MKVVGTKLDNTEYEEFEECCVENGLTKSEQLRDLIKSFVNEESTGILSIYEHEEEPKEESRTRVFDCESGTLYENGIRIGDCADYKMDAGKVYDEDGNFLGVTRGFYQK